MKNQNLKNIKKTIVPILRKNDVVVRAGIFSSFARKEAKKNIDVGILIEFKEMKSLLNLAGLEIKLENKLKRKADVLTYNSIHPLLKERILKEEVKMI